MKLNNILFIDIETVPQNNSFISLEQKWQELWENKTKNFRFEKTNEDLGDLYQQKAAIYAEFGKIVCIGLGIFKQDALRLKSLCGDDEQELISQFFDIVEKHYSNPNVHGFCGHNIREFDLPYICRRALIHGIKIPSILQIGSKKPWEVKYILDTLEYWRFGDYKNFCSLDLLAACLGLPSSKTDMHGSQVGHAYWEERRLDAIAKYCLGDVALTFKVYCKLIQEPLGENFTLQYIDL